MFVGGLQSHPWHRPDHAPAQSRSGDARHSAFEANAPGDISRGGSVGAGGADTSASAVASANALHPLAADIQAILIQARDAAATSATGTAATPGTGTGTSGSATAPVTPEQQLATDLQTYLSTVPASTASGTPVANNNPVDRGSGAEHHHHRHHHDGGGEARGSTAVAQSSGTATGASGGTSSTDQAVSRIFAADIAQALRAYVGGSGGTTAPPAVG